DAHIDLPVGGGDVGGAVVVVDEVAAQQVAAEAGDTPTGRRLRVRRLVDRVTGEQQVDMVGDGGVDQGVPGDQGAGARYSDRVGGRRGRVRRAAGVARFVDAAGGRGRRWRRGRRRTGRGGGRRRRDPGAVARRGTSAAGEESRGDTDRQ